MKTTILHAELNTRIMIPSSTTMPPILNDLQSPDLWELEETRKLFLERVQAVAAAYEEWIALRPGMVRLKGIAATYDLIRELEQPTSWEGLMSGLGGFHTLMMGRENAVLGLEETAPLPHDFSIETYHLCHKLQGMIPRLILPRVAPQKITAP